jgi:hypothetical protein
MPYLVYASKEHTDACRGGPMPYHLRRTDRAIADPLEVDALIRSGRYCAIALVDGEEPYVVTMNYGYDDSANRLYFHVAKQGHKLDIIAHNPRACATIVEEHGYTTGACEHPYKSVVLRGMMRVVVDLDEQRRALRVLVGHQEDEPEVYWASRGLDEERHYGRFTALAFEIEHITAKEGS